MISRGQETDRFEINSRSKPADADADAWHGDQVKLRALSDFEVSDRDKHGATNTIFSGRNRGSISRLTNDVAMEKNELGI